MRKIKRNIFKVFLLNLFIIFPLKFAISQVPLIDPIQSNSQNFTSIIPSTPQIDYEENDLSCHKYHSSKNKQSETFINSKTIKLEEYYSNRANQDLELQGYDIVGGFGVYNDSSFPASGIQENYIVGPGDEFILVLQGATTEIISKRVTREGLLIYDFTKPISVSGRPFYEIKEEIQTGN